jgi:HflK protein
MKKFFKSLALPFIAIYQKITQFMAYFRRIFKPFAAYVYESSDLLVRNGLNAYSTFLQRFSAYRQHHDKKYFYVLFRHSIYFFLFVMALIIIGVNYLFIVPVGSSAVITRYGEFVREVDSGLNIIFPIVERYYIVNSGNLFEETFGFEQGPEVYNRSQFNTQEQYVRNQYEAQIKQAELDSDRPFSERGDLFTEMNRRQRLTHDYIRRSMAPPVAPTTQAISQRIQQEQQIIQNTQRANITLDGKVPNPSEIKFLTGDLGIITMKWTIQYKIVNASKYLFNSRDVQLNIHDIALSQMNGVVGGMPYDKVITNGRKTIEAQVKERTQIILDKFDVGIQITQVIILDALPPQETLFAFNEVNSAAQDMERYIYQGQYEYMSKIPQAKGSAMKLVADANAYATVTVNKALGETGRFSVVNTEYKKAPKLIEDRMYIAAMEALLKITPHLILDKNAKGIFPLLFSGQQNIPAVDPLVSQTPEQKLINNLQQMGVPMGGITRAEAPSANNNAAPTASPANIPLEQAGIIKPIPR